MFRNRSTLLIIYLLLLLMLVFSHLLEEHIIKLFYSGYITQTIHMLYQMVYPILLGLYLGVPSLLIQSKKPGIWTFDYIKFLIICLPLLFLSLIPILYYRTVLGMSSYVGLIANKFFSKNYNNNLVIIGIFVGLITISCFEKSTDKDNTLL